MNLKKISGLDHFYAPVNDNGPVKSFIFAQNHDGQDLDFTTGKIIFPKFKNKKRRENITRPFYL